MVDPLETSFWPSIASVLRLEAEEIYFKHLFKLKQVDLLVL
jgi:hypothetical protein